MGFRIVGAVLVATSLVSSGVARLSANAAQPELTVVFSLKQISIDLPSTLSAAEADRRIDEFSYLVESITSCDDAEQIAERIGGHVISNDHVVNEELPPTLQSTVLNTVIGRATPVFGERWDGVRVLIVCDRRTE